MPTPERDRLFDAFFADERGQKHATNSLYLDAHTVEAPGTVALSGTLVDGNPLEGKVPIREDVLFPNRTDPYFIFLPDRLIRAATQPNPPVARISLLFCPNDEINRHGLRSFFADAEDRVLITVPGLEPSQIDKRLPWGIGVTKGQIDKLFADAGKTVGNWIVSARSASWPQGMRKPPDPGIDPGTVAKAIAALKWEVTVLACYSTGYRGLNGTINNDLIDTSKVVRVVFYDALYRGDEPVLAAAAVPPPKKHPEAPSRSPYRTWQALDKLRSKVPDLQVVTYDVSPGGTPHYKDGRREVDVPAATLIDLRPTIASGGYLTGLIWGRVLLNGYADGYFTWQELPDPLRKLVEAVGPLDRGTVRSSPLARAAGKAVELDAWGRAHQQIIDNALRKEKAARALISKHKLMGWQPPPGEERHDGFLQELGWEFLPA